MRCRRKSAPGTRQCNFKNARPHTTPHWPRYQFPECHGCRQTGVTKSVLQAPAGAWYTLLLIPREARPHNVIQTFPQCSARQMSRVIRQCRFRKGTATGENESALQVQDCTCDPPVPVQLDARPHNRAKRGRVAGTRWHLGHARAGHAETRPTHPPESD